MCSINNWESEQTMIMIKAIYEKHTANIKPNHGKQKACPLR
jgi:hypothetical protein